MFGSVIGNIIGTIYFMLFQLAGIIISYVLLKREHLLVRVTLGSVMGSIMLHWLPVLFAFVFGFSVISHILGLLTALSAVLFVSYKNGIIKKIRAYDKEKCLESYKNDISRIAVSFSKHRGFLIFLLLITILWCYLLYSHGIRLDKDGSIYTGQCGFGDMNMHLGFVTSIAVQKTFPPDYSIFPGVKLAYPFLSDSISSSIYILGASLRCAYNLPMIFAFLQIVCSVYMLSYFFLKETRKALLASIFFFINGGFGFVYFINWSTNQLYTFKDIFTGYYTTPTNLMQENIRWVNIIADMLLPQRATLFGYAILIPAIYLIYRAVTDRIQSYFIIAGVFGGALPLVHTHSFLAFGLVSASFLLMELYAKYESKDARSYRGGFIVAVFGAFMIIIRFLHKHEMFREDRLMSIAISVFALVIIYGIYLIINHIKENGYKQLLCTWGLFLVIVFLLAAPQLLGFTFGQVARGGFVRGCFNWGNQGDPYLWFYIKNIGIVFVLGVLSLIYSNKKTFIFSFPIYPIWFLAEMIAFAPNNYDNNKLLYIAYMFMCIIAADKCIEIIKRIPKTQGRPFVFGLIIFLATFSGILSLGREAYSDMQLYSKDQVEMAKWIEENTSPDDVFLSSDRHNNVIASMTGRNIVCGSGAFLYFHGIDTAQRNEDVKRMYEDPCGTRDLYEKYNVSYVCVSPYEWGTYETGTQFFDSLYPQVFEYEGTYLYKVN